MAKIEQIIVQTVTDQKIIRLMVDQLYYCLDSSYNLFSARVKDAQTKKKLFEEISRETNLGTSEIIEEIDRITTKYPILRGLTAAFADYNTISLLCGVFIYSQRQYQELLKNHQPDEELHENIKKIFDSLRAIKFNSDMSMMLYFLNKFCKKIIEDGNKISIEAENSTKKYITQENIISELEFYGSHLLEYYDEELKGLNLKDEDCKILFKEMMLYEYFVGGMSKREVINKGYNENIYDKLYAIISNHNEIEQFIGDDPRDGPGYGTTVYESRITNIARAIIINKHVEDFFSEKKTIVLETQEDTGELFLGYKELKSLDERQKKEIIQHCDTFYKMGDYRMNKFYKDFLWPILCHKRGDESDGEVFMFIDSTVRKYGITPSYDFIDAYNKYKRGELSEEEYGKKRGNYF